MTTGMVRWNATFLDFMEHHGVLPVASPPYWPRVKGKVERGVGYVKRSFLEGRSFTDVADLNQQLEHWLATVANVRVHGTTRAVPVDRHREELKHLRPSAAVPAYDVRPTEIRRLAPDCHFRFGGVRYSVPSEACGRRGTRSSPTPRALLDRLLHHATTFNIRGESYRLRHRRNAGLAVPPRADPGGSS